MSKKQKNTSKPPQKSTQKPQQNNEAQENKRSALELQYAIAKRMEKVRFKFCVISGKGGVGKTTVAVNLAYALAKQCTMKQCTMKKEFLGLVENMSGFICPHCGKETPIFGKGGARFAAGEMGVPFLGGVPFEVSVREGGDNGTPIVIDEKSESGKAFMKIVAKIQEEFGENT